MCFSVTASFVTSGALITAGGVGLALAKKNERLVASIPLLFALQQAVEGVQWLITEAGSSSTLLGYFYLLFAFILWPTYIPLAAYALEQQPQRKKYLRGILILGLLVSLGAVLALFSYPLNLILEDGNFSYSVIMPSWLMLLGVIAYSIAVVGSLLLSTRRFIPLFGLLVLGTEIAAATFFPPGFVSVWCFFAAVSSSCIVACLYSWSRSRQ